MQPRKLSSRAAQTARDLPVELRSHESAATTFATTIFMDRESGFA